MSASVLLLMVILNHHASLVLHPSPRSAVKAVDLAAAAAAASGLPAEVPAILACRFWAVESAAI